MSGYNIRRITPIEQAISEGLSDQQKRELDLIISCLYTNNVKRPSYRIKIKDYTTLSLK